ncbi:MAG: ABC transporter substrate-binding protein [Caldilineaceae bacterium]|nr:ABC transporter substrate-binding protein [Caldilineaceae bacterium]MDE0339480.1 ABC transporter substrate-binding protein [Caldilineaceae bacterium]
MKQKRTITRRDFLRYSAMSGSAALLVACAPAAPAADGEAAPAAAADEAPAAEMSGPKQGGTMTWVGHQEVAGLSPAFMGPTVHWVMIINIQNPLVTVDEFNEQELVLAKSIDIAADGLTYTFHLHEGVLFHDGSELTAEDVAYTYNYYRNPDNGAPIVGRFTGIGSVEAPDKYTVQVNMDAVNAASLTSWATVPIVHSTYHAEVGEETYSTSPIGTGPYKLKEWRPAEFTELEAFDDHFRGRPNIDVLREDIVPEPSVRMIALQTGEADSAVWPLLVEDSIFLEADPGYVNFRTLANSIKHFPLNNSIPQLAEKEVRQALMYALDRQRIIDELWNGAAQISHSNLTPASPYHHTGLKQYDFNPEEAMALLDGAGWAAGGDGMRAKGDQSLSFTITTITGDQARRPIAELAQLMFADVGVDVQLEEAPVATILQGMREGTMDASLYNWTYGSAVEPDPFSTLHSTGGNNFAQFNNARVDQLIEEGLQVVAYDEREPYYHEIQEIFVEEQPVLNLQFDEWMNVFNARIKGLPEGPKNSSMYQQAYKWWIEE